ncbi:MAG TPA: flagellar basal-body rod protein FlgG [Clostridia bacterium]|nr:flagellar basal-body rod protein FlgG [Clostridia bacterium]
MIDLLFKTASGLTAQQTKMDVTANNIANVNTNSFKGSRTTFSDLLYQKAHAAGGAVLYDGQDRADGRTTAQYLDIPTLGRGVRVNAVQKDFTQGVLDNTGRSLDLAINGNGFFRVTSPDGQDYFTRGGAFHLNEDGRMVYSNGFTLSPRIDISGDGTDIKIAADGTITASNKDGKPEEVGRIELYSFSNPHNLIARGDNLYAEASDSRRTRGGHPGENGLGQIRQGCLEKSNVDILREMNDLIEAQRAYQVSARAVKTAEEMWNIANNLYR